MLMYHPSTAGKGSEAVPPADFASAKSVPCPVARARATGLARALRAAPGQAVGTLSASLTEVHRSASTDAIPAPGALGLGASIVLCGALPSTLLPQSPSSIQQTNQIPASLTFGLLNISDELKAVRPRAGAAQRSAAGDGA